MKPRNDALSSSRAAGLKRMSSGAMLSTTTRLRGRVTVIVAFSASSWIVAVAPCASASAASRPTTSSGRPCRGRVTLSSVVSTSTETPPRRNIKASFRSAEMMRKPSFWRISTWGTYWLASRAHCSWPGASGANVARSSVPVKTRIRPGMIDSITSANSEVTTWERPSSSRRTAGGHSRPAPRRAGRTACCPGSRRPPAPRGAAVPAGRCRPACGRRAAACAMGKSRWPSADPRASGRQG